MMIASISFVIQIACCGLGLSQESDNFGEFIGLRWLECFPTHRLQPSKDLHICGSDGAWDVS